MVETKRLGTSELEVSRVIFGAWAAGGWCWGGADEQTDALAVEAMQAALDEGMTTIDTAPAYGFGHSERLVGQAVRGRRSEAVIATKCSLIWHKEKGEKFFDTQDGEGNPRHVYRLLSRENIMREIDASLENFGTDYVDLYQCHWPDPTTPLSETMGALVELLEEGKIRAIGVSNFTPEMIEECRRYGPVHSDQPRYSMLDRAIDSDLRPYCEANNVGVIVYSPLEYGLLTGKVTMDRQFPDGDHRQSMPWFGPENRKRAIAFLDGTLGPIAERHGKTLAQTAINWTLQQPGITSAIVGARNPKQVRENAGATGWALTAEELSLIGKALDELDGPG